MDGRVRMRTDVDIERTATLALLRRTRHATRTLLGGLDPEMVVHDDEGAWRVRDVVGHLGIWNGEAARSLEAHASGGEYTCIGSDLYDEYNGAAALERRGWPMDRVWTEYERTHDRLEAAVEAMPADRWDVPALYPWNERGTVVGLVVLMTEHETADHCDLVKAATASA
jgi:hypothetical protein